MPAAGDDAVGAHSRGADRALERRRRVGAALGAGDQLRIEDAVGLLEALAQLRLLVGPAVAAVAARQRRGVLRVAEAVAVALEAGGGVLSRGAAVGHPREARQSRVVAALARL